MPVFLNTAEGLADNAIPTPANSGGTSGDAWNTVSLGTGSTITATIEREAHGTKAYEFVYSATSGAHRLMRNFVEPGRIVTTCRFYITALPTEFEDVAGVRHSTGNMCVLVIGADGKFIMNDSAGAGITPDSRATNTVPTNQWITVQIEVRKGTTITDGLIGYRYFLGTEPTGTPVFAWSSAVENAGTTDSAQVWWGRSTTRTGVRTVWYDTMQAINLTTGWPAAYVPPNVAPTVVLLGEAFGLEPGDTQLLTINASDSDGTIATYAITQTAGSPPVTVLGTGANRSYVVPPTALGTTLSFTATVTDNDGASTTSAEIDHQVLPAALLVYQAGIGDPAVARVSVGGVFI